VLAGLAVGLTWILVIQPGAAQASGEEILSLETAIVKSAFETNLAARVAAGIRLESVVRIEGQDHTFRLPYCRLKSGDLDVFIGRASLGQGRALRKSNTSQVPVNPGSVWSGDAESTSADILTGFRLGGFSCFALWDGGSTFNLGDIGFTTPELSFKAAAVEAAAMAAPFSWALGACGARSPEEKSPDGWRGGTSYVPEFQALSLGASTALAAKGIGLELWSGACLGSLIKPGLAGSVELRIGGSSPDKRKLSLGLYFKAYACSESYRNHLLEQPVLDSALKGELSLGVGRFNIRVELLAASPREEKDEMGLRILKEKGLTALLWRLRTQTLSGKTGLCWGPWDLSSSAKVDQGGLTSCDFRVGYDGSGAEAGLRFKAAAHLYLIQEAAASGKDEDSERFEGDNEHEWVEQDLTGFTGTPVFSGGFSTLVFRRLRLDTNFSWGTSAAGGSTALALAAAAADAGLGFRIYANIVQHLGIGARCTLELSLATPSGGYALDCPPEAIPTLGLGFRLREKSKSKR
jgi:hypothetical protein